MFIFKGIWEGIDCAFGYNMTTSLTTLSVGGIVLSASRCFRSVLSCPVITVVDAAENAAVTHSVWETVGFTFLLKIGVFLDRIYLL